MSSSGITIKEVDRIAAAILRIFLFPGCRLGVDLSSTLDFMVKFLDSNLIRCTCAIQEFTGTYLSQMHFSTLAGRSDDRIALCRHRDE